MILLGPSELQGENMNTRHGKLRILSTVAVATLAIISLGARCDRSDYGLCKDEPKLVPSDELPLLRVEGADIQADKEGDVTLWYNTERTPLLMGYEGLKKVHRYGKFISGFGFSNLPQHWTLFYFSTLDGYTGMLDSSQYVQAQNDLATKWPNGEFTIKVNASYVKLMGLEKKDRAWAPSYVTFVGKEIQPEYLDEVNEWLIERHFPMGLKYEGLVEITHFQKIPGAGLNDDLMPEYLELYVYPDRTGMEGLSSSPDFQASEEDRLNTWKNGELEVPMAARAELLKRTEKRVDCSHPDYDNK